MRSATAHNQEAASSAPQAELIVQNGRLKGTRRSLDGPLTFIGKSPMCDLRLNVDGISPLHSLVVRADGEIILRDLESNTGTLVNGQQISHCVLHDGDQIMVGPFQFQIKITGDKTSKALSRLPHPPSVMPTIHPPPRLECDALRIQVAAVAAQQVALTEWELRLAQRETTLEKQQAQLAAHLEQKRQKLLDLHAQTQSARQALQKEKEEYHQHVEEVNLDFSKHKRELLQQKQQMEAEKKRLFQFRRRINQRFSRHWAAQRKTLQNREQELAEALAYLENDHDRLQNQKTEWTQNCLKLNTEVELGRRKLQLEWEKFYQEQHLVREQLQAQLEAIQEREERLLGAEALLEKEQQRSQRTVEDLQAEMTGLDNRVHNGRRLLAALQNELQQTQTTLQQLRTQPAAANAGPELPNLAQPPAVRCYPIALPIPQGQRLEDWLWSVSAAPASRDQFVEIELLWQQRLQELEQIAEELDGQRLVLVEQWQRSLELQIHWKQEQQGVAAEMLAVLASLQQKASVVLSGEQELTFAAEEFQVRHNELLQLRQHLAGLKGRIRAQEIEQAAQYDQKLASLEGREKVLQEKMEALNDLRQRWANLRKKEMETTLAKRETFDKASQEYLALNLERRQEQRKLEEDRRALTAQALALEQYRREVLSRSDNAAVAERRIQKLQRRREEEESRTLKLMKRQCEELRLEMAQLKARNKDLHQQLDRLDAEKFELTQEQTSWEQEKLLVRAKQIELTQSLQTVQVQRDQVERRLLEMQHEMEGVARLLLDEPAPPPIVLKSKRLTAEQPEMPRDKAA